MFLVYVFSRVNFHLTVLSHDNVFIHMVTSTQKVSNRYLHTFFRVTNILMIFSLQKLLSSVKTMEPEADSLGDQAQLLAQNTSEPRVISLAAQLSSRFTTLLNNARVGILCFIVVVPH